MVISSPEIQRKGQCSVAWQKFAGQTGSRVALRWSQLTAATLGFRRSYQDIRTRLELVNWTQFWLTVTTDVGELDYD